MVGGGISSTREHWSLYISYHGIYMKTEKSFRPKPTEGNGQSGLLKIKEEIEKAIGPHGQGSSGVERIR